MGAQDLSSHVHRTIGVNVHTTGWGINYAHFFDQPKGKIDGINFDYMTQNIVGERKDNRETLGNSRLVINKINNMYYFRAGVIKSYEIGTRQTSSNVGVTALLSAGPSISIYKPIYILYSSSDSVVQGIREQRYDPEIHKARQIFGKSSFLQGIGNSKVKVGGYFKASMRFDWGSYESNFKALEVGFNLNYTQNPEAIIYGLGRQNFHANLFMMINFGKILD
jgi:hypothetical protein